MSYVFIFAGYTPCFSGYDNFRVTLFLSTCQHSGYSRRFQHLQLHLINPRFDLNRRLFPALLRCRMTTAGVASYFQRTGQVLPLARFFSGLATGVAIGKPRAFGIDQWGDPISNLNTNILSPQGSLRWLHGWSQGSRNGR